jgi:hypothetical protein
VLLQRAELVHCGEHADELVQPLCKQLKAQEDSPLIHIKRLQQAGYSSNSRRTVIT